MADLDLDAIEAREDFATPGPWHVEHGRVYAGDPSTPDTLALASMLGSRPWLADADFIAHAREDVPALVAEVRRVRDDVDDLELTAEDVSAVAGLVVDSEDTGPHSVRSITLADALGEQVAAAVAREALAVAVLRLRQSGRSS